MSTTNLLLLLAGTAVVLALAAYALHLWRRVWLRQQQQEAANDAQHIRLRDDLRVLASSLLDEQLPLSEGAIRIKVLLDNYDLGLSNDARCQVFQTLFAATEHVPTHAGWKALSKEQRRQHEKDFSALELQHKAAARTAARWLLDEGLSAA